MFPTEVVETSFLEIFQNAAVQSSEQLAFPLPLASFCTGNYIDDLQTSTPNYIFLWLHDSFLRFMAFSFPVVNPTQYLFFLRTYPNFPGDRLFWASVSLLFLMVSGTWSGLCMYFYVLSFIFYLLSVLLSFYVFLSFLFVCLFMYALYLFYLIMCNLWGKFL